MASTATQVKPIVSIRGLTKRFGKVTAVDQLDLDVYPEEVFGLLGPNGAGKSSLIGMILGLVRPNSGSITMFEIDALKNSRRALLDVGAIVEDPAFYPYLSGRDNLLALARIVGAKKAQCDDLLELVGLKQKGSQKYSTYSTGMRQRLGLASVLLNDPKVVILDEPTRGLDPAGANEFRDIVRDIAKTQGRSVLISSHILAEVEQTCDRVAIINKGKTLKQGPLEELLTHRGQSEFLVGDTAKAVSIAESIGFVAGTTGNESEIRVNVDVKDAASVNAALVMRGIDVMGIQPAKSDLESYFLELTASAEDQTES
tara:strand:- start:1326 stop:2267 length:942 start_codon:yes stop_codon:yes gene_type:complete